ncbi:MAG: hypothetical protein ACK5H4_14510 [Lacrimispora sphenoides]
MKSVRCHKCANELSNNEIALNLKLLGKQIGTLHCYQCLSEYFCCDTVRLQEMAEQYKSSGCLLFQTNYTA